MSRVAFVVSFSTKLSATLSINPISSSTGGWWGNVLDPEQGARVVE